MHQTLRADGADAEELGEIHRRGNGEKNVRLSHTIFTFKVPFQHVLDPFARNFYASSLQLPTAEILHLLAALQQRLGIDPNNAELAINEVLASHADPNTLIGRS